MKNLFVSMSCFAAILLTSSCTPDSPEESNQESSKTPIKIEVSTTGTRATGDDKDPPRP
ncbi:hypothetical protein [Flavobacterium sp.]|jgi:hypothetical protein|uniref:hypothetical protein n=1 Tax=Flavobacterium sp. TaxID=239 RepID=UPI0037C1B2D9